jgi:transcriptional regulator with XRE-family HTH domain
VSESQRLKLSKAERQKLGEAARALREDLGWSKPELARRSSVGESTIRQIENVTGKGSPHKSTLENLSRGLRRPVDYLYNASKGIEQDDISAEDIDNATLISSVKEIRESVDKLREHQDEVEVADMERHKSLVRRIDSIGAMLMKLNPDLMYDQSPGIDVKYDHGQQSIS